MILKALCDYYDRCGDLPAYGTEEKQIGFIIVLSEDGRFLRFEDCRKADRKSARTFHVAKSVVRTIAVQPNHLYDNASYVLGISAKDPERTQKCLNAFKDKVREIYEEHPDSEEMRALNEFYIQNSHEILSSISADPLWEDISKSLDKKYSFFSFRIDGDTKIVAEKKELMPKADDSVSASCRCLVTGNLCAPVLLTTPTPIAGGKSNGKLVAFQKSSGYDSYGKEQGLNAPISSEAEFKYSAALLRLLERDSQNKFSIGSRTFVFWASSDNAVGKAAEQALFDLMGFSDEKNDDPNAKIDSVRKTLMSIYTGVLPCGTNDKFYILGLAPNAARISVVYWSETSVKDFAYRINKHFVDMEIVDTRLEKRPYMGLREMLSAVTQGGKSSDAPSNFAESVAKSIFQGIAYPYALFAGCIRRIRAEQTLSTARAAIIKAYLNRNENSVTKKIEIMLDNENTNQGYLCGRLFAVLESIQRSAIPGANSTIRDRYMNAASSTPASVFATLLNLSSHHIEKLSEGSRIYFEKMKQDIIEYIESDGFPTDLN